MYIRCEKNIGFLGQKKDFILFQRVLAIRAMFIIYKYISLFLVFKYNELKIVQLQLSHLYNRQFHKYAAQKCSIFK